MAVAGTENRRMRILTAALFVTGALLVGSTPAHADVPPEITVRYGWPSAVVANGGGIDLGTTTPGNPFTVALAFANDGAPESSLHVTSVGTSGGLTLIQNVPAAIAGGETAVMLVQCNATGTYTATVAFNTDDPDEGYYEIDLACSIESSGAPGMRLVNSGGTTVPSGGAVYAATGGTTTLHVFNDAGGKQPLKLGQPTTGVGGPQAGSVAPDDMVAADGLPVAFTLTCEDSEGNPLTGVFPVSVPDVLNETNFTFSLSCGVPLDDSGDGLPATGAPSLWLFAGALTLFAAGFGLRTFARRGV